MSNGGIRVGIDVGSFSVGMTTIKVDGNGVPLEILSAVSHIHDSGLDKEGKKQAQTRREVSGVARRARRLIRERRRRLKRLDETLVELGYPLADLEGQSDPYLIWRIRSQLVEERLPEETMRYAVSMALRHIARHRGWRNPYSKVDSLLVAAPESEFMAAMRDRILKKTGVVLDDNVTPGQAMQQVALTADLTMRGPEGILGKLHQSDNANEIRRICQVQGIAEDHCRTFIRTVFAAKSPRGSAVSRVGPDPLPGQEKYRRAPKCDPEFQRYRVISTVANLRVRDRNAERRLTIEERQDVVDFLLNATADELGWVDVAERLGILRQDLHGTAALGADGERAAARPPTDGTDRAMRKCGIKPLKKWWTDADQERRSAMTAYLYEGVDDSECAEFLSSLSEDEQGKLDSLHLPAGRAAYSRESLALLNKRMLTSDDDLHQARKHVFGVDDSWKPPTDPIGAPVGNPAVDRTLKMVARYLNAVNSVYGPPDAIQIEHVRDGFVSVRQAREIERMSNQRFEQNQKTVAEIRASLGVRGEVRRSDVTRYEAIMIQDGICVYCGDGINYRTAQLDHIVPQAGIGSNNRRENLVAVCERCNRSKSNMVFSVWAASCGLAGVSTSQAIERVKAWRNLPGGMRRGQLNLLKRDVISRLRRTQEDPELDSRSMESVAWMANELHRRVEATFPESDVKVYRGSVTAGARRAAGIDSRVNLLGEKGRKDRLDRRHHAVDAAVIALMEPGIAKTIAERSSLRQAQFLSGEEQTWKKYTGATSGARDSFERWYQRMLRLTELLNEALAADEIHVTENVRLRLGDGSAHDDTVRPLARVRLGDGLTAQQVDRASSPALWCAITREPDFDSKTGLPASEARELRVRGRRIMADDSVAVFAKNAKKPDEAPFAAIAVRDGFAEIGSTIHHARVYRIEGKKPVYAMLRVFTCDLLRHRHEDLFAAPILPQTISMRCAEPKLRQAIAEGRATYLGWLVTGDELEIPMELFTTGQVSVLCASFPGLTRWRINGFPTNSKLRLRPVSLSAEGVTEVMDSAISEILAGKGWRPAINLVGQAHAVLIRRDVLGRPRGINRSGLPASWTIE